ncbi:cold-shock protein [Ochrobactrum anthropi ATCC 49188]|uniref:Cold-shock protein n=1 Tax=Brucella tritici TaxID=94626 RepID=A0A7X6FTR9_9HYPH|nr:cold-shock protein [Brucella anthropi ATCC 49188]NKW10213.1 cold-shock protein [Brucella tritici]
MSRTACITLCRVCGALGRICNTTVSTRAVAPRKRNGSHGTDRTGQILQYRKGFGFIKPDDGGADIFVHISAVQASGLTGLADNQKVSYETEPDRRGKGPKAVNITVTG